MTTDVIRKFVEEDYKDCVIQVRCDNQILFYDHTAHNSPVIWDWDNECFMVIEPNDEIIDQSGHPMQIRLIALDQIQELIAYVDTITALDFINKNITDEAKKEEVKAMLGKVRPAMMSPKSLRKPEYTLPPISKYKKPSTDGN